LVPQEDSAAMADAIVKVCSLSDAAWRAMSDRAYVVASRYTWDDASARFESALRTTIERPAKCGVTTAAA
jgi:glycosyltransferase involved in cell wall biosynthesis